MHATEPHAPLSFTVNNIPTTNGDQEPKIIDLINNCSSNKRRFFSIEVSPRNDINLDYNKLECLPLFTAITWLGNENLPQESDSLANAPAILMGSSARQSTPILHHLTCHNLSERHVDEMLVLGVKNILALTGDNSCKKSYKQAKDLIQDLRRKGGTGICIAVAGYPDVHPLAENKAFDLQQLKEKVDAGADFIITQILFSSQTYLNFTRNCRARGITVPILPGVCLPKSFKQLQTILKLTGLQPTPEYADFDGDDLEFRTKMLASTVALVRQLFETNEAPGIHFFTLNNLDLLNDVLCRLQQSGIQFNMQLSNPNL